VTSINPQSYSVPSTLEAEVITALDTWQHQNKIGRLWARDASLWSGSEEAKWLGWLDIVAEETSRLQQFRDLAAEVRNRGYRHALLLGMGGSSLCPEVMATTFGQVSGHPRLLVLDSTDPARIRSLADQVDFHNTLFIVSSKSGTTLEPNIFRDYFLDRLKQAVGDAAAGDRFIAITDPESQLQKAAEADRFRHIFFGRASIGGRYSALSDFGLAPSAVIGVDIPELLRRALLMVDACGRESPALENPGVILGTVLGVLANHGRDKVTIVTSRAIADLGAWLEQLLAESTGKQGKGLIPVDREALGDPSVYGSDRVFAYVRLAAAPDAAQDAAIDRLEKAGQPVVRISVNEQIDIGQEFFRWEFATAVAGSIIGINAFNQPDVEASKIATRQLTDEYERTGALPPESPIFASAGIKLFTDEKNARSLQSSSPGSVRDYLKAHLARLAAGDYFALLAYIEMSAAHEAELQQLRHVVRDKKRVATCLGFGPRFLHSTGQAYKGGPNSGVFLQITCDDREDLPVPGKRYTFGTVKAAQARGDFQVLAERNRRALRVHLGPDVAAGLRALRSAIDGALSTS